MLTSALSSAAKERPAPVTAEQGRVVVSLDNAWSFAADLSGQAQWAAALPSPSTLTLPHSWAEIGARAVWYARDITLPGAGEPVEVQLNLDHPVGLLDVFLDGKPIAQFHGNGLPRHVRLQDAGGSTHRLALRLGRTGLPSLVGREPIYGLGHITMELLPPTRIDALTAVMDSARQTLAARYRLAAETPVEATLKLEVLAAAGDRVLQRHAETFDLPAVGASSERVFTLKRMLRWSPREAGNTYRVHATLLVGGRVVDERALSCGAAAVTFNGTSLLLDGQAIGLKGVRLPGGIPLIYTTTLEETLRNELALARRAGFNAIMADGSALPEEVLAVADELGMLVIGEIPAGSDGLPLIRPTLEACAHHPSIIAWSWAGAGDQAEQLAVLRELDPSRLILLRDGAQSRLIDPRNPAGQVVADLDFTLPAGSTDAWWERLERLEEAGGPVLATGIGVEMAAAANGGGADVRGNTATGDEALGRLRGAVESLRSARQFPLLGYFVRLPDAETLTGLSTPSGNPTNALTTSLAYNGPCAIVMRVKSPAALAEQAVLDAAIVCDEHLQGDYQLYQVVTSVEDGKTAITSREVELTGKTARYDLRNHLSFAPDRAGEYRLQLVLSQGDRVIASTRVARITVSPIETASRIVSSSR
jgi:hypothetical protein